MMDIIVDKSIEALKYELMATNTDGPNGFYQNKFVETVTNKSISADTPSMSVAVVEVDSVPVDYEISSIISQTKENYLIQIQFIVRAASEEEAKEVRRILTQRIKHAMLRKTGKFRQLLLTATDEETGYTEGVRSYKILRTSFDNTAVNGTFIYFSLTELQVQTEVNYNA